MTKRIYVLFRVRALGAHRNIVLDRGLDTPHGEGEGERI